MTGPESPRAVPRPEADGPATTASWACDGPAEIELYLNAGAARVDLVPGGTTLDLTITTARSGWRRGLGDVLAALGGPTEDPGAADLAAQALADSTVDGSGDTRRLVVHSPRTGPARRVALVVSVVAPADSRVLIRAGSAATDITGPVGRVDIGTGAGDVHAGHLLGGGAIRTGAGDVAVDAVTGNLDVRTTSGTVRVGIAPGTLAELDLRCESGRAASELVVLSDPGSDVATARVHVRTGSGDVVVHAARGWTGTGPTADPQNP